MDWKLGGLIAVMSAFVPGPGFTQASPGLGSEPFIVYGTANESCGSYIEARRMPGSAQAYGYSQFVSGYMTASGIGKKKEYPPSISGIEVWLENYCQKNPEQSLLVALGAYTSSHDSIYRCTKEDGSTVFTGYPTDGCKQVYSPKGR